MARVELGRRTELSPASITSITGDLIAEGLIRETDSEDRLKSRPGRPQVRLALDPNAALVLALRISINRLELRLARYDGSPVASQIFDLPSRGVTADDYCRRLAKLVRGFLDANRLKPGDVFRVGAAIQGITDTRHSSIAWSPAFTSRNIPVGAALEEAVGAPVSIANDSNLMARVLARSTQAGQTAVVIFTGYGVGAGIIINGRVYDGPTGAAAEFGHMNHVPNGRRCRCGRNGCIEAYAADYAILRSYQNASGDDGLSHETVDPAIMSELQAKAAAGDLRAHNAFRVAGHALGYGIGRAVALLDARKIVIAGPGARAFDHLKPGIDEGFELSLPSALAEDVTIEVASEERDMIAEGLLSQIFQHADREMLQRQPRVLNEARSV
jgi:predicted NBD/HSP70 family sugar kinase